jgi:hypothetical protein
MSTMIATPSRSREGYGARLLGLDRHERRGRQPWVHHGVASERAERAERAYATELALAERAARGDAQARSMQ